MRVLIVVDMQNDFITGALGTNEAQEIIPRVVYKIKKSEEDGDIIIFTRDTHKEDYLNTQEGEQLPIEHCIEGTYGWQLHDSIQSFVKDSLVYNKNTFGAKCLAKDLEKLSEKEEIEEIELCGLCTDICVISNVMLIKAFLPETKIIVDSSACAGVTKETHKNALEAMKMCQIEVW